MMRSKSNAYASDISHSEDCIMVVRDWLEDQDNPDNLELQDSAFVYINLIC